MFELKKNIETVINRIDENTNLFYQNRSVIAYKNLDETLRLIGNLVDEILIYEEETLGEKVSDSELVRILSEAMNALEIRDELLLSDVLQYDLKEFLIQFKRVLL